MFPSSRRLIRSLTALATIATLLTLPQGTSATPRGRQATLEITPMIAAVSVEANAAFGITFTNSGRATLTKPRFTGTVPGGTFVSGSAGCSGNLESVTCRGPNMKSGAVVTFTVVFAAPDEAGTLELSGSLAIDSGNNNPNAASKDTYTDAASIAVIDSPDFFATWQDAHASPVTFATGGLSGGNGQTTSVSIPPVGFAYPATLSESGDDIVCGGEVIDGIGQTVDLSVANGQPVDPFLTLTLTYQKDVLDGRTPWTIAFVHQRDDGTCELPPRDCEANPGFCFDAAWSGYGWHKKLILTVQLPTNGRGKGL
jgi:uncharacterized repeat protein (TIGR01451 family)